MRIFGACLVERPNKSPSRCGLKDISHRDTQTPYIQHHQKTNREMPSHHQLNELFDLYLCVTISSQSSKPSCLVISSSWRPLPTTPPPPATHASRHIPTRIKLLRYKFQSNERRSPRDIIHWPGKTILLFILWINYWATHHCYAATLGHCFNAEDGELRRR